MMFNQFYTADFIDDVVQLVRSYTEEDQNSIVCLRPSPFGHPAKYSGKYYKSFDMYPPSMMPASCNGQATWLNRNGKCERYRLAVVMKYDADCFCGTTAEM